jgi:type IV pilus assembly protein PilQ|nr:MAG TPA: Type II secretion system protein [Inoviridae sp.]
MNALNYLRYFYLASVLTFFVSSAQAETGPQQLTFDFQTIPVSSALQLLADYRGLNLVLDENIRGSLSMRMKDVSWDEAIEYVTSTKGILYTVEGKFLRVSAYPRPGDSYSANSYASGQDQQFRSIPSFAANSFDVSIFKVHNILASDAIKAFPLDPGETLNFEDGSSIIVARMGKSRLDQLKTLIAAVDYSRKQVMIQARIVEVDRSYSKNLGVQWGGTVGSGAGTVSGSVPLGFASGAIGAVGIVSSALNLDARLSAMEQEGRGRVISSPRVYTSDRHQAKIVKGSEVPYQQSAGDGATATSFKQAALSLDVTPIVNGKGVLLDVILSKDEPDYSNAMNGVPPINTTSLTSRVFSPFGQTIALGGVYSDLDTTVVRSVPYLGKIPGFKWLFTSSSTVSTRTELVLFLTPVLVE